MEKKKSKKIYYHKILKKKKNIYINFNLNGFDFIKKKSKKRRIKLFEKYYKSTFKDFFFLKKFYFSTFKNYNKKVKRVLSIFFFNSFSKKLYWFSKNKKKNYLVTKLRPLNFGNDEPLFVKIYRYHRFNKIFYKDLLDVDYRYNTILSGLEIKKQKKKKLKTKKKIKKSKKKFKNKNKYKIKIKNKKQGKTQKKEKYYLRKLRKKAEKQVKAETFKYYKDKIIKINKINITNLKFETYFFFKTKYFLKKYLQYFKKIKKKKKYDPNFRYKLLKWKIKQHMKQWKKKKYNIKKKKKIKLQFRFLSDINNSSIFLKRILNKKNKCYLYEQKKIYTNLILNCFYNNIKKKKLFKSIKKEGIKFQFFLESKLNVVLLRTGLFHTKDEINLYIKLGYILINEKKITNLNYILKNKDIIQFTKKLQKKVYEKIINNWRNNNFMVNIPYYLTYSLKTFTFIYNLKQFEKKNCFKQFFFSNFINYKSLCFFNKNISMPS